MAGRYLAVYRADEKAKFDRAKLEAVDGLDSVEVVLLADGARQLITAWSSAKDFEAGHDELEGLVDPEPDCQWAGRARSGMKREPKWYVKYAGVVAWVIALVAGLDAYVYRYVEFFGAPEAVLHERPLKPVGVLRGENGYVSLSFMNIGRVPVRLTAQHAEAGLDLLHPKWHDPAGVTVPELPVGGVHPIRIRIAPKRAGTTTLRVRGQVRGGLLAPLARFDEQIRVQVFEPGIVARVVDSGPLKNPRKGYCRFLLEVGVERPEAGSMSATLPNAPGVQMRGVRGPTVVKFKPGEVNPDPKQASGLIEWTRTPLPAMSAHPIELFLASDKQEKWRQRCNQIQIHP